MPVHVGANSQKKPHHIVILRFSEVVKGHANSVIQGVPYGWGWISKLYYREVMYILELSKAPFLMIRAYILFFEEIFNF